MSVHTRAHRDLCAQRQRLEAHPPSRSPARSRTSPRAAAAAPATGSAPRRSPALSAYVKEYIYARERQKHVNSNTSEVASAPDGRHNRLKKRHTSPVNGAVMAQLRLSKCPRIEKRGIDRFFRITQNTRAIIITWSIK